MNKKIFLIILFLFICFIDVNAETIQINGKSFNIENDINGDGYYYNFSNNILELNNYNGGFIKKDGLLNIVLKGENTISGNNILIQADDITITGDGNINFNGELFGINANNISISNCKIDGNINYLFVFKNNLSISKTNIDVYSKSILIMGGYNISIVDSTIKSESLWGFRFNMSGKAIIENSNLNFTCLDECLNTKANFSFIKTNALFYGKTAVTKDATLSFKDSTFTISNDGINYSQSDVYKNHLYLKIVSNISNNTQEKDDLNNNDTNGNGDTTSDNNTSESNGNNNDTSSSDKNDSENDDILDNVYTNGEYTDSEYTESEYTDTEYSDIVDVTNPKTGDNVIKWLLIFGLSIILLIIIGLFIKRNIDGKDKIIFFE